LKGLHQRGERKIAAKSPVSAIENPEKKKKRTGENGRGVPIGES